MPSQLIADAQRAGALLDAMAGDDVEVRFGFHRLLVLVSGPDNDEVDRLMVELGARGVGRVLRDLSTCAGKADCCRSSGSNSFGQRVADEMLRLMVGRKPGKRALCASGGGITGIYFEMGALKCLDDCLYPNAVNTFDMYFGISAGALVSSFLANGFTVDECMAAIAGYQDGRLQPISLSLLRPEHVNFRAYGDRITQTVRDLGRRIWKVLRGQTRVSLEGLVLDYSDSVPPPLHGDAFARRLGAAFAQAGGTNDFRKLSRPLFVGATDQDARTHLLFGDEGWDDVPISAAVQASTSINPAFSAVRIRGRYYEDGAVTRTSNFVEAIHKGADLLFVIDPFVPYVSKTPGFARQRGILYNVDQDIRTVSYTRFEQARNMVLGRHPHVSLYTFLPANRLRRLMSVNPMDHRPYMAIWRGAYLSTLQRVLRLRYRMSGDVAAHGLGLDTARAEAVAERLKCVPEPELADFFPDGRIVLRPPVSARPLLDAQCVEEQAAALLLRRVGHSAA
jgi:predicted acylesterase/phospholipase RssA